jgi:predicted Zn-ribbon and HTH transcriptional regulator
VILIRMSKEYELPILRCSKCLHSWIPRTVDVPKVCPVCKRTDWADDVEQKGGC